jgi:hypothetical protein
MLRSLNACEAVEFYRLQKLSKGYLLLLIPFDTIKLPSTLKAFARRYLERYAMPRLGQP